MNPIYKNIHPKFKLNGIHYNFGNLKEWAYSQIKEGEAYEKAIGNFLLFWLDNSPTLKVNTSGSTGIPKTISLKKEHMVNSAVATGKFFTLGSGIKVLNCLPANFIAGKMMLVRAMVLGWELDLVAPTASPLDLTSKFYDFGAMVPLQVQNSMSNLNQIKALIIGGAPISPELKLRLSKVETKVFETYGMTETVTHIAVRKLSGCSIMPNFKALSGVVFSTDERGCLVIDAPKVSEKIITTNDLAHLISSSEFQWQGRYDNVINSGGVKLIPEQLELKLSPLIHSRFFVSGIPDKVLGQKLILVVEGILNHEQLLQDIKSLNSISKYEIPKEIVYYNQFIETGSGKINRNLTLLKIKNANLL